MKENPESHIFLDEVFGINLELLGELVKSLPDPRYLWIAFQNKKCPNEDDLYGISLIFNTFLSLPTELLFVPPCYINELDLSTKFCGEYVLVNEKLDKFETFT